MSYECRRCNRPLTSSSRPLYQNEVKCLAFDKEMIFHSHANKTHFHKKGCSLDLILKVRVLNSEVAYSQDKVCVEVMTYASRARW